AAEFRQAGRPNKSDYPGLPAAASAGADRQSRFQPLSVAKYGQPSPGWESQMQRSRPRSRELSAAPAKRSQLPSLALLFRLRVLFSVSLSIASQGKIFLILSQGVEH